MHDIHRLALQNNYKTKEDAEKEGYEWVTQAFIPTEAAMFRRCLATYDKGTICCVPEFSKGNIIKGYKIWRKKELNRLSESIEDRNEKFVEDLPPFVQKTREGRILK